MRTLTLFSLVVFLALPALAWPGGPGGHRGGPPHVGGPPPDGGLRLIERHADELGIEDDTLEAIRETAETHIATNETLKEQIHALREELRETLEQPQPAEAEVVALANEIGALETQASTNRLLSLVRTRALLTDEQSAALVELGARRHEGKRAALQTVRSACAEDIANACGEQGSDSPRHAFHCLRKAEPDTLSEGCTQALEDMRSQHHGRRHGPFGRRGFFGRGGADD